MKVESILIKAPNEFSLYKITLIPFTGISVGSCFPSPFLSNHTKSPIEPYLGIKPASTSLLSRPESPIGKAVLMLIRSDKPVSGSAFESIALFVPAKFPVKAESFGVTNFTK